MIKLIKHDMYNFALYTDLIEVINDLLTIANRLELDGELTERTVKMLDEQEDRVGIIIQQTMYNRAITEIVYDCVDDTNSDTPE